MNRRGFLKAAGGLAVAAPVQAVAPALPAVIGSFSGGAGIGTYAAGNAVNVYGGSAVAVSPAISAMWGLYNDLGHKESARARWYEIYRSHRRMVRRGRAERKPAKLLWLLDERRRISAQTRLFAMPKGARKSRIIHARIRKMMQAAGFPGLPWERNQ